MIFFLCYWYILDSNQMKSIFFYVLQNQKKKLDTEEFLRIFTETTRNEKFQKDITLLMEPSSDTKWCEPRDHVVMQPSRKDTNSWKAK